MKTPMQEFAKAVIQWNKDWNSYNFGKTLKKPQTIEQFIKPYLEKEKQMVVDAVLYGATDFRTNPNGNYSPEDYFNNKYIK